VIVSFFVLAVQLFVTLIEFKLPDATRSYSLSRRSHVTPSPRRPSPTKWPQTTLTYCPVKAFNPYVNFMRGLTQAIF
jgi:hypothetical protein